MDHSAVVERDELVLPAPLHPRNTRADEGSRARTRDSRGERSMEQVHAGDDASHRRVAKDADRSLDLWQLGHDVGVWLTPYHGRRQVVAVSTTAQPLRGDQAVDSRSPAVRRVLLVVLALNAVVLAIKIGVGVRTGALTVLGAALDSGLDLLNNVIGMMLVSVAARAPDEEHPYGHAKFETLGALGIVGFLSISCFELLRQGIVHLASGGARPTTEPGDVVAVAVTVTVNAFVVWYERGRGKSLRSAFLQADAAHTQSDILITLLAVASLALSRLGHPRIDAGLAIVVALLIAWSGWSILRESIPILVDERAIDARELARVVCDVPSIIDVRSARSRFTASGLLFAEVTIVVARSTTVEDAHRLADDVEAAIAAAFGTSETTVHIEPA